MKNTEVSNEPLPPLVLYTASLKVAAIVLLSEAKDTEEIVGTVRSYVQLNWVAAVLLLLAASVNVPAATSMVTAPSAVGVNVAVYTVLEDGAKLLKAPLGYCNIAYRKICSRFAGCKNKRQRSIIGGRTIGKGCSNLSDQVISTICNIHIAAAVYCYASRIIK